MTVLSLRHWSKKTRLFLIVLLGLLLLFGQPLGVWANESFDSPAHFPQDYGQIVYRSDTGAPSRIYIIANSHRSPLSGKNGQKTLQSQIETFRIGEWLIRQRQVDLLLPEGFFGSRHKKQSAEATPALLDETVLEQRLSDTSTFVNAELLLHEAHGISMQQVEDRTLYLKTRNLLHAGGNGSALLSPGFSDRVAYLQRLRTAAILQKSVPAILTGQRHETSLPRNAVLTIGLSHLDDLLGYLDNGEIRIDPPIGSNEFPEFHTVLELSRVPIDVTVIVPTSLLEESVLVKLDPS